MTPGVCRSGDTTPKRPLDRARDIIDRRYAEPCDIDMLAQVAQLSRGYFAREFHGAFNLPPHQYLIARRMQRAAALMRTTDYPVARVCASVGLHSVGSFTTRFVRTFGIPPAAYRMAHPPASRLARTDTLRPPDWATCEKRGEPSALTVAVKKRSKKLGTLIRLTHVTVWVRDANEALAFYTGRLGMELRVDATLREGGGERWITVGPAGQPDIEFILSELRAQPAGAEASHPGPKSGLNGMDPGLPGALGCFHLATDDCWASYAEFRNRGVVFDEIPTPRPYGIRAAFRDPTGNVFQLVEPTTPSVFAPRVDPEMT